MLGFGGRHLPPLEKRHAITFVRLSIEPSQIDRLQVYSEPRAKEWVATIALIKKQRGWRYTFLGQEADVPGHALIIIAWLDNVAPPPRFSPGSTADEGPILPDMEPHLTAPPNVFTLWHARDKASKTLATTLWPGGSLRPGPPGHRGGMAELISLRGPEDVLRTEIAEIMFNLDAFNQVRNPVREGNVARRFSFSSGFPFIIEGDAEGERSVAATPAEPEGHETATFAFIMHWSSKIDRETFRDPSITDETLSEDARQAFGETFWEDNVAKPFRRLIQEHGVILSSWDYYGDCFVAENEARASVMSGYRF